MTTFAISIPDPAFDPRRPIAINGHLYMPAGGQLRSVDQRPVPQRPAHAKELVRG